MKYRKKLLLLALFYFSFCHFLNAQKSNNGKYDSLWYFHPFSFDIQAGIWKPVGKLSEYFNPSAQFEAGLNIGFRNLRVQYMVKFIAMREKRMIPIQINNSITSEKTNGGAGVSGLINYTFNRNKFACSDIIAGLNYESLSTLVINPTSNDIIRINSMGFSTGVNSWINTFSKLNLGVRAIYTYSRYDKSKYLASSIGRHSFSFSLVYRFPKPNQRFESWYKR